MAQIFHRSFNVVSKVSIFGFLFFVASIGWVVAEWIRSPYSTNTYVAVEQPVPFSHQHHVGDLGIDCRYCHNSVEDSSFAGLPSTKVCMNCHSQIWLGDEMLEPVRRSFDTDKSLEWNRVHDLADFVYFNHSIHVKKGMGCNECHGQVDQMPLTWKVNTLHMEWCLECHREPEKHVRPREEVFNMQWERPDDFNAEEWMKKYRIRKKTSCSTCHR